MGPSSGWAAGLHGRGPLGEGRATAKEAGHLVQSPGKPGKGLEKPAGRALLGAHWSVWLLLYEAAWVTGERGSGRACGWGPLRGTWDGLISGGLTRVKIRPGRLREDTTQVWDASSGTQVPRLWSREAEAAGSLSTLARQCQSLALMGVCGQRKSKDREAGRQTGSRRSHISNAHGWAPEGWSPFPAWLAVCPTVWPY